MSADHVTSKYLTPPERIVKPRTRQYQRLSVIAICNDDTLSEEGEVGTLDQLLVQLPTMPPTLLVTVGSADLLARMNTLYSGLTSTSAGAWQYRVSSHERDICRPDGVRIAARVSVAIHYLGWKGDGRKGKGRYHKMIDPVTMYGRRLDEVMPEGLGALGKLLKWGISLRDFCDGNSIEVRPTNGAISAQFLTDPRFYDSPRRKVPAVINQTAREQMPGNFYRLEARTDDTEYSAIYLDQSRAHHYHARHIRLPDANLLYAHGRFMDLDHVSLDAIPQDFYGLFCLDLLAPDSVPAFSQFPAEPGLHTKQFVFSNELPHLLDMGYKIQGIRACWGSRKQDTNLPRYAEWALRQLDEHNNAAWLKPLLLSAYGVLAIKPRHAESVFRLAKSGTPTEIHTGKYKLPGLLVSSARKLEPRIANVIHRGMIEAATRSESVGLAQHLEANGHNVLSIYADAVIVQASEDKELPFLPEPWRIKERLTHLQFLNQQAFMSGEMTKLPGVVGRENIRSLRPVAPKLYNVAEEMEMDEELAS